MSTLRCALYNLHFIRHFQYHLQSIFFCSSGSLRILLYKDCHNDSFNFQLQKMVSRSCGRNSLIRVVAIAAAGSGLFYGSSNPDSSELYFQFFLMFVFCVFNLRKLVNSSGSLLKMISFFQFLHFQHFRGLCLNSIMIIIFEL